MHKSPITLSNTSFWGYFLLVYPCLPYYPTNKKELSLCIPDILKESGMLKYPRILIDSRMLKYPRILIDSRMLKYPRILIDSRMLKYPRILIVPWTFYEANSNMTLPKATVDELHITI